MGSETKLEIPSIDFTKENLKPGTDSWVLACKQIRHGLEEYGCFEVVYDKVPIELHNSIFDAASDLFDLPGKTKLQNLPTYGASGYIAPSATVPLYESLGINNPTILEGLQSFTNIMWPEEGNDCFREKVHSFSTLVDELYGVATRMIFDSYGVERLHESHIGSTSNRLRFFKYRLRGTNESNVGLITHTDKTFISIINQDQVRGLEIKTKDDQYIEAKAPPSSFLFLAGDVLMHRVIIKENKVRYSVGLFSFVKGVIQVPEELVDDRYPLRYKPIDHFDYLNRYFSEPALKESACPIKLYAGV
ncbi:hypothetical protein UlMin_016303 [Ulmus minor]